MSNKPREFRWTVETIHRDLKRHIRHGIPGNQLAGERALAKYYDATCHTIRKALAKLTEDGLIERTAGRMTFLRPRAAEQLAAKCALNKIVMVYHDADMRGNPFVHHVANGADRRARAKRLDFQIQPISPADADAQFEAIRAAEQDPYSTGWVLSNLNLREEHMRQWLMEAVPFVMVDQIPAVLRTNAVAFDSEQAVHRATEHLAQLGHKAIGCVGAIMENSISRARRRGFHTALAKHDLPFRPEWIVDDSPPEPAMPRHGCSRQAAKALLERRERPTGLVCFNVRAGGEVLEAAAELGIAVPAQLSVIAAGSYYSPDLPPAQLTRIDQGRPEQLGELAVDLLTRADPTANLITLLLEGHLVESNSTAPPLEADAAR